MKYSPAIIDKICDALTELSGRVEACKVAGISYETFTQWMRGNIPQEYLDLYDESEHDRLRAEFSERVKKAEEQARANGREVAIMSIFSAMAKGVWQAGAWWLERNFPEEFMERKNLNLNDSKDIEEARGKLKKLMEELQNGDSEGSEG